MCQDVPYARTVALFGKCVQPFMQLSLVGLSYRQIGPPASFYQIIETWQVLSCVGRHIPESNCTEFPARYFWTQNISFHTMVTMTLPFATALEIQVPIAVIPPELH